MLSFETQENHIQKILTHRVVTEEDLAPLVVHEEEEGEHSDDETGGDHHHHDQAAVHVLYHAQFRDQTCVQIPNQVPS